MKKKQRVNTRRNINASQTNMAISESRFSPNEWVVSAYGKISFEMKLTFIATLVAGLAVHLYMFTNRFVNHDEVELMLSPMQYASSGRWFLHYASAISSDWSMPWINGLLAMLYLSVAACLIHTLLKIQKPLYCVLSAALLASFPALASAFSYMACTDIYMLSLLFAVFGVYITQKWKYGFLIAAVPIAFSLGIYQAYFCVAASLFVALLVLAIWRGRASFIQTIQRGVQYLISLIMGLALYLILVKITTINTPLTTYKGMNEMGNIPLHDIPKLIKNAYKYYFNFFLQNIQGMGSGRLEPVKYIFVILVICCLIWMIYVAVKRRLEVKSVLLMLVLLGIFPLASNLVLVMAPKAGFNYLVSYAFVLTPICMIALIESSQPDLKRLWSMAGTSAISWTIVAGCVLMVYFHTIFTNQAYMKMDLAYEQAYAYTNRLVGRVESAEGFTPGGEVVFIGRPSSATNPNPTPKLDELKAVGILGVNDLLGCYSYASYVKQFFSFNAVIHDNGSKVSQTFMEIEDVQNMPVYPESGSVKLVNEKIVVKFRDLSVK